MFVHCLFLEKKKENTPRRARLSLLWHVCTIFRSQITSGRAFYKIPDCTLQKCPGHTEQMNMYPLDNVPSSHPWASTLLLSVFVNLTAVGTAYKRNHIILVLLWLFISLRISSGVIHVVACVRISFLLGWNLLVHSSWCTLGITSMFWLLSTVPLWHGCTSNSLRSCFWFLWVSTQKWSCWIIWETLYSLPFHLLKLDSLLSFVHGPSFIF